MIETVRHMMKKETFFLCFIPFISPFLIPCQKNLSSKELPKAVNGILDVRNQDFKMDGYKATKQVKANLRTQNNLVITLTASLISNQGVK